MKKLLFLLLAVIFTACSAQQTAENSKEYTLLTQYTSGTAFTGKGVYQVLDHTDGSTDILFIDIDNGTRIVRGDMSIDREYSSGYDNLFVLGDYVYYITESNQHESPDERKSSVIYKFSKDGKLVKKHSFDKLFHPAIHRFAHDGKDLYFIASQYTKKENEFIADTGLYRLDTDTFKTEKLCDAGFGINGAWKNQLIVAVYEKRGNKYTDYIETVDMTTYEHRRLFETEYIWFQVGSRLYNQYEIPGSLKVYDLETDRFSEIKLFDYTSDVDYYWVDHYEGDPNILFTVKYKDNTEKRYVYDISASEIKQVAMESFVYGKAGDYYLVAIGEQTINIGNEMYERVDNVYAFVKCEDYINGNPQFRYIASSIEYR